MNTLLNVLSKSLVSGLILMTHLIHSLKESLSLCDTELWAANQDNKSDKSLDSKLGGPRTTTPSRKE